MLTIAIIDLLCFRNFNVCAKNDDRGNQKSFPIMASYVRIESLLFIQNSTCIEMRFIRFSWIFCNDKHITFFNDSYRFEGKIIFNPSKENICNLNAIKYKKYWCCCFESYVTSFLEYLSGGENMKSRILLPHFHVWVCRAWSVLIWGESFLFKTAHADEFKGKMMFKDSLMSHNCWCSDVLQVCESIWSNDVKGAFKTKSVVR